MKIIQVEQKSPEWLQARLEKISGTRLCAAIGSSAKQEALLNELIAERVARMHKDNYVTLAMAKGIEAEDPAIEEYELKTGEMTEKVGICVSDKYDWLINSPDRLILAKGIYRKAVEVKCPNDDTQIKYIRAGILPGEYEAQIMSYFLVNENLEELDFVSYCPRFQTDQYRLWIKNVKREELNLKEAEESVLAFYEKWQDELVRLNLSI
jgi:putative phage-type endonuclease